MDGYIRVIKYRVSEQVPEFTYLGIEFAEIKNISVKIQKHNKFN